jgi:hypothetical protein
MAEGLTLILVCLGFRCVLDATVHHQPVACCRTQVEAQLMCVLHARRAWIVPGVRSFAALCVLWTLRCRLPRVHV